MKVVFIARPTLYTVPGGDTVQLLSTAKNLNKLGVQVDIRLGNEKINYSDYNLVHFFNIIDPEDILGHAIKCKKPYLISTIYVDYSEYDRQYRKDLIGTLSRLFSYGTVEYLKTIGKFLLKNEGVSSYRYFIKGHTGSIRYILIHAACLLPNSHSEYKRLAHDFGISLPYFAIPNAIDPELFSVTANNETERKNVICVARLEGRKNQLNLIRALKNKNIDLYLIGQPSENQKKYITQCKQEASANVHFVGPVPQTELTGFYKKAKVHVLPSWFETTGLSSLEAAVMGCNIVVADKGDVREYFGEDVFYCNPADEQSIYEAVKKAYDAKENKALKERILKNYTWQQAAIKTKEAYEWVLNKSTV